jgi:hypothetical protein
MFTHCAAIPRQCHERPSQWKLRASLDFYHPLQCISIRILIIQGNAVHDLLESKAASEHSIGRTSFYAYS